MTQMTKHRTFSLTAVLLAFVFFGCAADENAESLANGSSPLNNGSPTIPNGGATPQPNTTTGTTQGTVTSPTNGTTVTTATQTTAATTTTAPAAASTTPVLSGACTPTLNLAGFPIPSSEVISRYLKGGIISSGDAIPLYKDFRIGLSNGRTARICKTRWCAETAAGSVSPTLEFIQPSLVNTCDKNHYWEYAFELVNANGAALNPKDAKKFFKIPTKSSPISDIQIFKAEGKKIGVERKGKRGIKTIEYTPFFGFNAVLKELDQTQSHRVNLILKGTLKQQINPAKRQPKKDLVIQNGLKIFDLFFELRPRE